MLSCVHIDSNASSGQSQADANARREVSGAGVLRTSYSATRGIGEELPSAPALLALTQHKKKTG